MDLAVMNRPGLDVPWLRLIVMPTISCPEERCAARVLIAPAARTRGGSGCPIRPYGLPPRGPIAPKAHT